MANVGTADAGKVLIGAGQGASPRFASIGTNSGLTAHGIVLSQGNGAFTVSGPSSISGQLLQSKGLLIDPSYTSATYPSTTVANQVLYSSATNTISGITAVNSGVFTTGLTGVPVITALTTNGQLIIGSTAGAPAAATLTAGTGISISNGSNSITITSSAGGITWSEITSSPTNAGVNNGYIANLGTLLTINLPANFAVGDVIHVVGKGAGLWTLVANTGDIINFGNSATSSGGSITATSQYDAIQIIGITTNTTWACTGVSQGNLSVA